MLHIGTILVSLLWNSSGCPEIYQSSFFLLKYFSLLFIKQISTFAFSNLRNLTLHVWIGDILSEAGLKQKNKRPKGQMSVSESSSDTDGVRSNHCICSTFLKKIRRQCRENSILMTSILTLGQMGWSSQATHSKLAVPTSFLGKISNFPDDKDRHLAGSGQSDVKGLLLLLWLYLRFKMGTWKILK